MLVASGTLLVLVTWALCGAGLLLVGLPAALTTGIGQAGTARRALWWGSAILTVVVLALSLVVPLRSPAAALGVLGTVLVLGALGIWLARRTRTAPRHRPWTRSSVAIVVGLACAALVLAAAALGPVTNYDSGLYHLGAIAYAGDFTAIPGLANLYFPLGYATATFPLAAFLGNGPWDGEGYRLLNGLVMVLAMVDLALRLRERRRTPGLFVLAVGTVAMLVPMVALADYWVTSPTSDSAVLALTVVAVAYLADAVSPARRGSADGAVASVIAMMTVLLRPTMAVFAGVLLVIVVLFWLRSRKDVHGSPWWSAVLLAIVGAAGAVVISARDRILSGWLQFPLSIHAFDVPWRSVDPAVFRQPTLGAARDPLHLWEASQGWGWVGPWLQRLPQAWEAYEIGALLIAAVALVVIAAKTGPLHGRGLLAALGPSAAAAVFWWAFTPPSFRFAWGPLFTLLAVPCGWALWRLAATRDPAWQRRVSILLVVGVAIPLVAVSAYTALARTSWGSITQERSWQLGVSVPYAVAPMTQAPVVERTLPSGLTVLVPTASDQCWTNYPLCTPQTAPTVHLRGTGLQEGFLP